MLFREFEYLLVDKYGLNRGIIPIPDDSPLATQFNDKGSKKSGSTRKNFESNALKMATSSGRALWMILSALPQRNVSGRYQAMV